MVRGSVEKTLKRDAAGGSRAAVLGDALRANGGTEKRPSAPPPEHRLNESAREGLSSSPKFQRIWLGEDFRARP